MSARRVLSTRSWLLILVAGLLGMVMLTIAALFYYRGVHRGVHRVEHAAPLSGLAVQEPGKAQASSLGEFVQLEGGTILRAPLHRERGTSGFYSSKGGYLIQNYLYVDAKSHGSHWLKPGHSGLILETTELPATQHVGAAERLVETVVYKMVEADTDRDGSFTERDLMTIAISDLSGKRFVRLLSNVQRLHRAHLIENGAMIVLYASAGELHIAEVDLAAGKIVRDSILNP